MSDKKYIKIDGKEAAGADVISRLAQLPKEPTFIDFQGPAGWITIQGNMINRCWQILRTLPDGQIETADKMFSPEEALDWWANASNTPEWYVEQTWRTENRSTGKTAWRLIFVLLGGLLLMALGVGLIYLATAAG